MTLDNTSFFSKVSWSFFDRSLGQVLQLVFAVILASLLLPEDFGLIGMLMIFLGVSQILVDGGMQTALIQKPEKRPEDYSTVLLLNVCFGLLLYAVLFVSSRSIASFYEEKSLVLILRILGLIVVINSLGISQRTWLINNGKIRQLALINVSSILVAGLIAVFFALMGLGVWAIVLQSIVYSLVALLLVWWQGKLQFSMFFSKNSFKSIFIFSRHLLIANIYSSIVNELFSVIIGKFFAKQSVGYYVQSRRLTDSVSNSLAAINNQVFLPMLSSNREEDIKFLGLFRAAVTSVAFVSAPMMVLIMILSEPFVIVFLGEKWIDAVPILRYLSLSRVLLPLSAVNMMVFNAMGRSDLYLKVDMAKLPLLLIILIITIPQGLISMVQGLALAVLLSYTLEAIILGRILKFGLFVQLRDTLSIYIITFMMGAIVYVVIGLLESGVWKICLGSLSGLVSYVVLSWVFQKRSIERIKCLWE